MAVVVDALVGKVLEMLISTVSTEIEQNVRLVVGVENEVEKLKSNLESIQAVLIDAERRQLKEASVQLWLDRLKEVAYDIDDVVDEWNYEIARSQIRRGAEIVDKPVRKVLSFNILASCSCFPKVVSRHHIAVKINVLNERLDVISKQKELYGFQLLTVNNEQFERTITISVIDETEVKGRDADKEKLVKMLLAETSHVSNLPLIPVVGMGGIGKTTLAKLVYHDERVKSHFDRRIWVCVSDPFDETKITKEILEFLGVATTNLVSLPNMMEKLQESVRGKKILFVLDDVWNEDPNKWKQLGDCLKSSLAGSSILVTTRNENVGKRMGCLESDIYRIGLLSDKESWELFCMVALSRKSSEERVSLEEMGREVVRRCKGLPLAVRTMAGLLQFKHTRIEWQSVLESELWDLEEFQRDFVAPLWLSYYNLPSPLKQCFSYCAIFPKDHEMEKGELINLWMAQGYIKGKDWRDMETLGDQYFQNLVMRSLFQDVEAKDAYEVKKTFCKMHDLVHDFSQSLVKKECRNLEVDVGEPITLDDSIAIPLRHLGVNFRLDFRCLDSFYSLKRLRSLHISTQMPYGKLSFELNLRIIFDELTSLRSISLYSCGVEEIPSNINKLIHLRMLDLTWNDLSELPDTLGELYNLQTLILDRCDRIKSMKGFERLTNLRHIDGYGAPILFPKEMAKLNGLRKLGRVSVDVENEEAFSLKHLKNLNQLGGSLQICWLKHCDGDVEDAKQAQMQDKKLITQLNLTLHPETHNSTQLTAKKHEDLIEALSAPPHLEFLKIDNYMGLKPPSWITFLTSLKAIHLQMWRNSEHLPALGKFRCLQYLSFACFEGVKKVGDEFLGTGDMMLSSSSYVQLFPKLRILEFASFGDWEEWNDSDRVEEILIMPNLNCLKLKRCRKLKTLPKFILHKTALELEIRNCRALKKSTS